ncbi:Irc21 protein [Starmerella bacillaris]|uniref:Irc21 protein n=1 Tax=Starmerella bacillaris TaxID=1247836 RepID=A0AAV5RQI6_STABA|nr:Irc21 protein [Starmerella bacillaris]
MGLQVPSSGKHERFKKVPLTSGHSALDWARKSGAGVSPMRISGRINDEELKKHNSETDCWVVVNQRVYDVTEYLLYHPGGVQALMECAGQDATELFMEYHPWVNYDVLLKQYYKGVYTGDL